MAVDVAVKASSGSFSYPASAAVTMDSSVVTAAANSKNSASNPQTLCRHWFSMPAQPLFSGNFF